MGAQNYLKLPTEMGAKEVRDLERAFKGDHFFPKEINLPNFLFAVGIQIALIVIHPFNSLI